MRTRAVLWALGLLCTVCLAAETSPAAVDARIFRAWSSLRNADCARCHGANHEGLAAPSIVEFVRTQSKQRVLQAILQGNPARGMPGYETVAPVREQIEAIYDYFRGRAAGSIPAGKLLQQVGPQ